ncbi:MAG: ATP-binding protein [Rhodoferax sp.]|uniref:hybrid sensor histidine kinase/response regulator n=1 Tax=Rhodoferax sp. TaxID=50421 RepID=UPI0026287141|nr:ATP-binding protein [Rhodoferax sp.]MDD5336020.1 ATP-binding protein [Rhodoferax sp.]
MRMGDIRSRILWAAMLPVTLIVVLLVAAFLVARVSDQQEAHSQGARSLAHQLAAASEYGLFSANIAHLQTVARGALREADVRAVTILNADGEVLVNVGLPGYTLPAHLGRQETLDYNPDNDTDLLVQPITVSQLKLDDPFDAKTSETMAAPKILGHVLIEFSHEKVRLRERELFWLGLALGLAGLLLGGLLALRLGRRVIEPVARVSRMIERIGQGELTVRAEVLPDDPLRDLQLGLNQMARRLESGRDEMERRIASATAALREKKEEAETATLAKSRFLAAASHDLRQPTHALGMFVARLQQFAHSAETTHLIKNMENAVLALQDLLDGLLDISRLDAMTVQVQVQPFALADIFDQLGAELTLTALDKGLRLRIRPTKVWLLSDPTLLHRILLNLLGNALRYTKAGGVLLACRVRADGKRASIEVWDTGIGIAPEHQRAIFKEFYQVGNLERDRGKGMGLGLNIVERTAQLLGHRVQLRSRPGTGTRFSIEVPLLPPGTAMERPGPPQVKPLEDLVGLVVLVIEDDALAREGLVSLLVSWGALVVQAEGLTAAQWQLKDGLLPDLIISDYRLLDGENGIDTVRQLRAAAGRPIPACLMSGDTDPDLLKAAKDAGLTLLHKPVRPAKLRSLIRRLTAPDQTDGEVLT